MLIGSRRWFASLAFLLCVTGLVAQSQTVEKYLGDYAPIKCEGSVPSDILSILKGGTSVKLNLTDKADPSKGKEFSTSTEFTLKEIFTSGNIYFNDPFTPYVRSVADSLLKGLPQKPNVRIYVSRYSNPNATAWQDGTLIVNVGLLSRLENEAQLAFIIGHEIAHYVEQHPYRAFVNRTDVTNEGKHENFKIQTSFSVDQEMQADNKGIEWLMGAGYSGMEAIKAFGLLFDSHVDSFNIIKHLSSDSYQLTEAQLCMKSQYLAYKSSSYANPDKILQKNEITQRLNRLKQRIPQVKFDKTQKFKQPESLFNEIVTLAQFEQVENSFTNSNFLKSIYYSIILLDRYPTNKYLRSKVAENLHSICVYNEKNAFDRIFFDIKQIDDDNYAKICCFFNNAPQATVKALSYGYVNKLYKDTNLKDPSILITTAKSTELFKGITSARPIYKEYTEKFPNGEHVKFAKSKLNEK